ncbi:hypothetical protein RND71_043164 [Anisodus tanguticus]|uniref:Uncharacterized protein n=1 Tax=Anisodus tanguticus TaxID=243964 RepID=A0AAE1UPW5_9SOLA|nr:hypothetical protein RND71_043164 [Anisodus tanguticus]
MSVVPNMGLNLVRFAQILDKIVEVSSDRANLLEDEMTSRKTAGLVDLQNEDGIRSSAPCNNEEKGSAFLVQENRRAEAQGTEAESK